MSHVSQESHDQVFGTEAHQHKAKWSHKLIGGTTAFKAIKAYEDHQVKNSKPDNHALAKEIFAGLAGTAIDHLVETKGLDAIEATKAKHYAKKQTD
ncbi:CipC-like antibiotic stress responsive protein [Jimgerdemannia flammicorona]|uniref:CipC-like antibiotic stress responsive protein n=1 Tax=Jimgerdemannia flammicorona TaxID=994334 RepID=A0A433CYD1_9FUNG|nr:CipC-like antibiotic stress responsive protein [Jimgerdemannia flammicorona]